MARTYKVVIVAGSHTWTVTDESPPTAGLMDPLTISWANPDPDHRPTQPDPVIATFSVVAATAGDLDDLFLGSLVTIDIRFGPDEKTDPDVVFYGRIAQGDATPHPQGMLYTYTCADLTADLAGYDLGAAPYPVAALGARVTAMLTAAGLSDAAVVRDPVVAAADPNLYLEEIDKPSAGSLLTGLIELWAQVGLAGLPADLPNVTYLGIIAPHPPAGTPQQTAPTRWALDALPDAFVPSLAAPLPATFGPYFPPPAAYGLYIDPNDRAAGVIDACVIELGAQWAALQAAIANRAAVTWLTAAGVDPDVNDRTQQVTYVTETPTPGQPQITATRDTQTIGLTPTPATVTAAQANADRLAGVMIPVPQNLGGWAPDGFRWLLYKDPLGLADFPLLFPRHDLVSDKPTPRVERTACYVRPVVITSIPSQWHPADADRDWFGGQLNAITLTISEGRPVVDFELTPTLPEPGNPATGTASWNAQAGTWNAQAGTWDQLVPGRVAFRWSDTSLVGITWNQLHPQPWNMYRLARGT